jgi:hypothetical protein
MGDTPFENPVDRIKAELPEFCTLVTVARRMTGEANPSLQQVMGQLREMIAVLVRSPDGSTLPTLYQRSGADAFLYASDAYTQGYAEEMDRHTKRLARSCAALREALDEVARVKEQVLQRYNTTLLEFEDIVHATSRGRDVDSSVFRAVLEEVLEKRVALAVEAPARARRPVSPSTPPSSPGDDADDQEEEGEDEEEEGDEDDLEIANALLAFVEDASFESDSNDDGDLEEGEIREEKEAGRSPSLRRQESAWQQRPDTPLGAVLAGMVDLEVGEVPSEIGGMLAQLQTAANLALATGREDESEEKR